MDSQVPSNSRRLTTVKAMSFPMKDKKSMFRMAVKTPMTVLAHPAWSRAASKHRGGMIKVGLL